MRKGKFTALAVLLMLCLTFASALPATATSIQGAKDEKSRLEKRQKEIQTKLDGLEAKKSDIVAYIEALDAEQQALEQEIKLLDEEIERSEMMLEQTRLDLEAARQTVADQYDIMKRRIKYMYENGSGDYLDIFLNAESLADLLNQAEYMAQIAEYDNELLGRYEESKAVVEGKEADLEQQLVELAELSEQLKLEKATTEQLAADKAVEVEKYNQLLAEAGGELETYNVAIAEQEKVIDQLIEAERKRQEEERKRQQEALLAQQNAQATANGEALLNGGLIWPLPSSTRITSGFGSRGEVLKGSGTFHYGVDIGTPSGNNILAAASGTVVEATYNWSMGNYVLLYHGSDIYTVYMHSSKLLVSKGDYVDQGDVIALVGSTGLSTGPHLHFGLKVNGSYVNPLKYVAY